jgi:hypothetical protein
MVKTAIALLTMLSCGCGMAWSFMPDKKERWERASSRPDEEGVTLTCSGQPCGAVPVSRSAKDQNSVGAFVAGTTLDLALLGGGIEEVHRTGNAASGALLATSAFFILFDVFLLSTTHGLRTTRSPWEVNQPVVAQWQDQSIRIQTDDVVAKGEVLPRFSVSALARKEQCSTTSLVPRTEAKLVVFDPVSTTRDLRSESARYLSEVVRARTAEVAPAVKVFSAADLLVALGGRSVGDDCDVTCRLGIAQELGATLAGTADLYREDGEFVYQLTFRDVRSGARQARARAVGKDLSDLDSAVRNVTNWFFGCR